MEVVVLFEYDKTAHNIEMEGVWKKSLMVLILALFTGKRSFRVLSEDES